MVGVAMKTIAGIVNGYGLDDFEKIELTLEIEDLLAEHDKKVRTIASAKPLFMNRKERVQLYAGCLSVLFVFIGFIIFVWRFIC